MPSPLSVAIPPKFAECPKHGLVPTGFNITATDDGHWTTDEICSRCYIEWVSANVPKLLPAQTFNPAPTP